MIIGALSIAALNSQGLSTAVAVGTTGFVLTSLGVGSGQFYADDFWRGILLGAGFYPALSLGSGVGYLLTNNNGTGAVVGGSIAAAGYLCWAAYDAYQTALRTNDEHSQSVKLGASFGHIH